MSEELDQKLLNEALQRIARTPDGRFLYMHLQKVLMGIPTDQGDGALRENLGRRKFAAEIRAVMSEAVKEQDPKIDERAVIFTFAQPVALTRPGSRGARRRIADPGAGGNASTGRGAAASGLRARE